MPDQAFSKISSLAGPKLPARHQTLNHFLKLTTSLPFDRLALIKAVEVNAEALRHCLLFVQLDGLDVTQWHKDITDESLCDIALMLGNKTQGDDSDVFQDVWQRPRLSQLLVHGLASCIGYKSHDVYRLELLASLLNLGHQLLAAKEVMNTPRDLLLAAEQQQFGLTGSVAGADWLAERGFAIADCDVIRYQYESVDDLVDACDDIVLVALAGRIADAMLTDFKLADQYCQVIEQQFAISEIQLQQIFEQAYIALRAHNDEQLAQSDFDATLAIANLGQQFTAGTTQGAVLDLAAMCFGIHAVSFGIQHDERLVLEYVDEQFRTHARDSSSILTKVFQSQTPFSAEENALVAILDKQILSRMAANVLWVLPLQEVGVIVCGAKADQFKADLHPFLIACFVKACRRLLQEHQGSNEPVIEISEVQARVRELTHEVNNPLAIVQNYLKTLSLRLGSENTAQTDIKTISDEMLRIGGIIQQYAQIGSEPAIAPENVAINSMLQDLASLVRGGDTSIRIELNLDEAAGSLWLHASQLKQVLLNLMKNAVEALRDTPNSELVIATQAEVNFSGLSYLEITLSDNGPGIPLEIYQGVFTAQRSTKGEGHSGLGLSVAHRLVSEMGGFISCRTSLAGTQFQILLPKNLAKTIKNNNNEK